MPAAVYANTSVELANDFQRLAASVREQAPDLVILVARKMPRLASVLALDFGTAQVASDMALPFLAELIRGRRVALVDDFINVGTTINRVHESLREFAPALVTVHAIARRLAPVPSADNFHYVRAEALSEEEYRDLVSVLPMLFEGSAEAYDLEFPLVRCNYTATSRNFDGLVRCLAEIFGSERIHCLWSSSGECTRCTLTISSDTGACHTKLRFYDDAHNAQLNVVPVAVPPVLDAEALEFLSPLFDYLQADQALSFQQTPDPSSDAKYRLGLFVLGLAAFQQHYVGPLTEFFSPLLPHHYDATQAAMAFGPRVTTRKAARLIGEAATAPTSSRAVPESVSAFLSSTICQEIQHQLPQEGSLTYRLEQFFKLLDEEICSQDPENFSHDSPYPAAAVRANQYLRLRIGPSFDDLISLIASDNHSADCGLLVSRFLDEAIDQGFVVPTIAEYERGRFVRIYRKGETGEMHDPLQTLAKTIIASNKNMPLAEAPMKRSPLHITKIAAILSFSSVTPPLFSSRAADFGVIACLHDGPLSYGGEEITLALRKSTYWKQVEPIIEEGNNAKK